MHKVYLWFLLFLEKSLHYRGVTVFHLKCFYNIVVYNEDRVILDWIAKILNVSEIFSIIDYPGLSIKYFTP